MACERGKVMMDEEPEKMTIMVVDDTPANLQLLRQMMQDSGYHVVTFPNGQLALNAADRNTPDLILLDINMPEMNGFEVCQCLKNDEKLKEIPVIFISALNETSDKVHAFSVGGVDYVTKPFQFEEVKARVRTHISLCIARRELKKQNAILQENMHLREVVEEISRHDLKNPMNVFNNVPDMLLNDRDLLPELLPKHLNWLNLMKKAAQQMMEMIHRSLDLYKMERGTYQLTPVPVNLLKIVHEVFLTFDDLMVSKKLASIVLLDQKPAGDHDTFEVQGEEYLFFSLLSNLIKNAIEASPEGKAITVALSVSPKLTIAIKNQGVIPPQIRERFFERYTTFGKEHGTGLGVFSARLMVTTLGGDLSFTSDEVDGTTLFVTLPSLQAAA